MNNLWPVQQALFGALTANPQTYPVYDNVLTSAVRPYIVIGEFLGEPDEELTLTTTAGTVTLHTWSAASGKAQTHAMLQFIRARLDGQVISGTWACTEEFNELMEDEGSTAAARLYHGVARYQVRVG